MARNNGAIIHDNTRVDEIIPGDIVTLKTSGATYRAKQLILCPGPWAKPMLNKLGLEVPLKVNGIWFMQYCFFRNNYVIKVSENKNAILVFAFKHPNILRTSDELSRSTIFLQSVNPQGIRDETMFPVC